MRSSLIIATTLLAALSGVSGSIIEMTTAPKATIGKYTKVTMKSVFGIIHHDEYGIIWGLRDPSNTCDDCIGRKIGYVDISNQQSDMVSNHTYKVNIPDGINPGNYVFVAAIPDTVGAPSTGAASFNFFTADMLVEA